MRVCCYFLQDAQVNVVDVMVSVYMQWGICCVFHLDAIYSQTVLYVCIRISCYTGSNISNGEGVYVLLVLLYDVHNTVYITHTIFNSRLLLFPTGYTSKCHWRDGECIYAVMNVLCIPSLRDIIQTTNIICDLVSLVTQGPTGTAVSVYMTWCILLCITKRQVLFTHPMCMCAFIATINRMHK